MMRWGRKKPVSFGASSSSGLSRALPVSWLSKFKGMNVAGSDSKPAKETKQDETWQNMSASSLSRLESDRRICESGNNFRRLPVGKENATKMSEWYESAGALDFRGTSLKTCGADAGRLTETELGKKFDEMMNKVQKKRRELPRETEDFLDIDVWDREKGSVIMTPRLKFNKEVKKWVRNDQRLLEQKLQRSEREEKDTEVNAAKPASRFSDTRATSGEDSMFLGQNLQKPTYQWQKLKETKLKEVKLKAEQQRKSMYITRELSRVGAKQNKGVRVFSPRASFRTEKCRVKAIEDLKKARLRTREQEERAARGIWKDGFAVVKCSCDPWNDFRDSMIEMITENGISRPDELKELLVCYLTLNTDEYHEMIIKVFRDVWVDLKHRSYIAEVQNLHDP